MKDAATSGRDWPGLAGAAAAFALGVWMLQEAAAFTELAAVFPRTIALVMMAAAVLLSAQILIGSVRRARTEPGVPWRRAGLVATAAGWVLLVPVLGFLTASLAGFVAAMLVARFEAWTPARWAAFLAAAVIAVGGFYLLFAHVLGVPFPRGLLI